jgi:hypothetical protein
LGQIAVNGKKSCKNWILQLWQHFLNYSAEWNLTLDCEFSYETINMIRLLARKKNTKKFKFILYRKNSQKIGILFSVINWKFFRCRFSYELKKFSRREKLPFVLAKQWKANTNKKFSELLLTNTIRYIKFSIIAMMTSKGVSL